jgi:Zn-finger nucleic acid-binding protein
MNQRNFAGCSGVVIDVCKPHGIWFDRQELQRVVNFIQDGGLHKTRENELAKLKEEQETLRVMRFGSHPDPGFPLQDPLSEDLPDERSLTEVLFALVKRFLR